MINNDLTTNVKIISGTPIVRTDTHFTKYYFTKTFDINKLILFSFYNSTQEEVSIEITDGFSIVEKDFNQKQYIGTGFNHNGEERIKIFNEFKKHYEDMGYTVLTGSTDHPLYNRAGGRNVIASIFPNEVSIIMDSDIFLQKYQIEEGIKFAKKVDGNVQPCKRQVEIYDKKEKSIYEYIDILNTVDLDEKQKQEEAPFSKHEFEDIAFTTHHNYLAMCWIFKSGNWHGMDERCLTWGREDIIFHFTHYKVYDRHFYELTNGYIITLSHGREDMEKSHNHNEDIFNEYKDLEAEETIELLKKHAGFGTYGKFVSITNI